MARGNPEKCVALERKYGARNYHPLPVVLKRGRGPYVYDAKGRRYMDMLSAYSALNQGHNHPKIVAAAKAQLGKLALVSRAFHHPLMGPLLERLCRMSGLQKCILMNSGAEGVETAIKAMRLWGYRKKGIAENKAEIIVARNNFHGRTTTIVGFSSDPLSRGGFGPRTPGFKAVPFGDAAALKRAITPNTCGFLVEPVQGEAGIFIPPAGYLREVRRVTRARNVLLCLDEIQTGLGRTGRMFCFEHEGARPDLLVLGKALSGGLYPVSAVLSRKDVLGLFTPGTHGSTFGGNPLACAVAMAALDVLIRENLPRRAQEMGAYFYQGLCELYHPKIKEARGIGLLLGLEFTEPIGRKFCEALMRRGILAKDTHEFTVRFAPPLVVTKPQIDWALGQIRETLAEF